MSEPAESEDKSATAVEDTTHQVRFHFIKSTHFRVIHADGILAGTSPNGNAVHISFYSERAAIPLMSVHELEKNGSLGAEIQRIGREGVVREIDVDVVLSLDTAKSVLELFKTIVDATERQQKLIVESRKQ